MKRFLTVYKSKSQSANDAGCSKGPAHLNKSTRVSALPVTAPLPVAPSCSGSSGIRAASGPMADGGAASAGTRAGTAIQPVLDTNVPMADIRRVFENGTV